jgi:hypothetical protein
MSDETENIIIGGSTGFFKTVFNFDENSTSDMMNIIQYTFLAILPCVFILKVVRYTVPEDDESKGSLEILAEILIQLAFMVVAMYFSNKAIRYIPTYSGTPYSGGNDFNFYLPFLLLLLTMQSKIGSKVNLLYERGLDLWHGRSTMEPMTNTQTTVRVTQPFSGHKPTDTSYDTKQLLPTNSQMTQLPTPTDTSPNFNHMYQEQNGMQNTVLNEPLAANEVGSGFSGW